MTGLWAYIDPHFVTQNAAWFAGIGGAGLLLMWFIGDIRAYLAYKAKKETEAKSPIEVLDWLYPESLPMLDEKGRLIEGVRAVVPALRIGNSKPDGRTLRNIQARLHFIDGESVALKIRNLADPTMLRHGELGSVELGYIPVTDGFAQASFSNRTKVVGSRVADEHNARNGPQILMVSDGSGGNRRGIGGRTFSNIQIVITADDVPAKRVWLDMDLQKEKAWEWFTVKSEYSCDD